MSGRALGARVRASEKSRRAEPGGKEKKGARGSASLANNSVHAHAPAPAHASAARPRS
jgi:hypothetical protein